MIANFQLPIANLSFCLTAKIGNWQSAMGNNQDEETTDVS